jgi:hypothetical protein
MPVIVRLARRQLSRKAPEFGHECLPHESTMRPFGSSLTVHGWSPCFPQKGHIAAAPFVKEAARTVAQPATRDNYVVTPASVATSGSMAFALATRE